MGFVIRAALFLFAAAFAVNSAVVRTQYSLENAKDLFNDFMVKYNKNYDAGVIEHKFEVFKQNLEWFNKLNNDPNEVNEYVITKFADLTQEEIKMFNGHKHSENMASSSKVIKEIDMDGVPDSFDWREKNGVTSVKDQGQCGSCWAFSVIGAIEAQYLIKKQQTLELSEQQLVDCDTDSNGCHGGYLEKALSYVVQNGVESNSEYPYISGNNNQTHQCSFDQSKVVARISNYNHYQISSEDDMRGFLYRNGPLSIAIDANNLSRMNTSNVIDIPCSKVDHDVLLVGYGDDGGSPYWIVKNSWGANWGERQGYFYLKRGSNSACITTDVAGPVL